MWGRLIVSGLLLSIMGYYRLLESTTEEPPSIDLIAKDGKDIVLYKGFYTKLYYTYLINSALLN